MILLMISLKVCRFFSGRFSISSFLELPFRLSFLVPAVRYRSRRRISQMSSSFAVNIASVHSFLSNIKFFRCEHVLSGLDSSLSICHQFLYTTYNEKLCILSPSNFIAISNSNSSAKNSRWHLVTCKRQYAICYVPRSINSGCER